MEKLLRAKLLVPILVVIVTVATDVMGAPLEASTLYTIGAVAIAVFAGEEVKEIKEMIEKYKV